MKLDHSQFKNLLEALIDAFNLGELKSMLRMQMGERLDVIAPEGNLKQIVYALICWAEQRDRVEELVQKAYNEIPTNDLLKQVLLESREWTSAPEGTSGASKSMSAVPSGDPRLKKFRAYLTKICEYQEAIQEWKNLHNKLDGLIQAFDPYFCSVAKVHLKGDIVGQLSLTVQWREVTEAVGILVGFGKNIEITGIQYAKLDSGYWGGEDWAVKIDYVCFQLDQHMNELPLSSQQNMLSEPTDQQQNVSELQSTWWSTTYELSSILNDYITKHMNMADSKLLESLMDLDNLSQDISHLETLI